MCKIIDGTKTYLDAAAQIWAEATSARDGDDVAPLDLSRPVIARVLGSATRAFLLVAVDSKGTATGFAAIAPVPGEGESAELHYIGVSPRARGSGVARDLMAAIPNVLKDRGFSTAKLSVYSDNARAVTLYEKMGWRRYGIPTPHARSGRLEQQYRLSL
jgi:ribosomal protein S18 acetylase RimI-like enzyme